ncbi:MAG: hypothetical protein V3W44_08590 [Dehalococcoidales bacterium]
MIWLDWIIANWEVITGAVGALIGASGAWWGWAVNRAKRQLVDTIGLSNYHNDEFRKIAKREKKGAALRALKVLLP